MTKIVSSRSSPIYTAIYLKSLKKCAVKGETAGYLESLFKINIDTALPKCTNKSQLCGNACVPKSKKCKRNKNYTSKKLSATQSIDREEGKIRNLSYERAIIIDSTGSVKLNKGGTQTSVEFTREELAEMKGAVLTHNHPNLGWKEKDPRSLGLSFSKADIECAANNELSEIRAVSSGYNHSLKPGKQTWTQQYYQNTIKPVYEKHEREVYKDFTRKLMFGRMRLNVAEADYHHEVISRASAELEMDYKRSRVNG